MQHDPNTDVIDDEPAEKVKPVPKHVKAFYDRLHLGEKGVWGKDQVAISMRALLLREQNVTSKRRPEPFGRLDRRRAVEKLVKEGKVVKVGPRNVRETAGTVHPATIDALLDQMPAELKASPAAVASAIGKLFGLMTDDAISRKVLRSKRWLLNRRGRRMPMHIREGAIISTGTSIALAKLFPDQCTPEHLTAVEMLRARFGEAATT